MEKLKFFFIDRIHFNPSSYRSLYEFINAYQVESYFNEERVDWLKCFGDYTAKESDLRDHCETLKTLNQQALREYSLEGINIFDCAVAELLCYLIPQEGWKDTSISTDKDELFDRIYKQNTKALLLNMAATISWINFWKGLMPLIEKHTHVLGFSGSTIYTKALLELIKKKDVKPLIVEHLFTGTEFYLEERYTPIANNSDLRLDDVFNGYSLPKSADEKSEAWIQANKKMFNMRNKNVVQPASDAQDIAEFTSKTTVLIIGQAVNDFSLIETAREDANSIQLYSKLITGLLEQTNHNIIFKAHPWERKKPNTGNQPVTLQEMEKLKAKLPESHSSRLMLLEDYNIYTLFKNVSYVAALCSQGAIEAAFYGLKPVMFGNPFFGRRGFTYDCKNTDEAIKLLAGKPTGKLTDDEFGTLQDFLIITLLQHMVPVDPSGAKQIEKKLFKGKVITSRFLNLKPMRPLTPFQRKMKKLKSSPKAFFKDMKSPALRWAHVMFKE